ncbi:MAG: hypothetical protein QOD93_7334, partial [Acetobacteraceae bacterium]|nr:hypothetical protein [Acetobacteraceae bacterium]
MRHQIGSPYWAVGGGMNERPRKATRLTVSLEEQD